MIPQVGLGGAVVYEAAGFVVDEQQLEDAAAALIAGEGAGLAPGRGEKQVLRWRSDVMKTKKACLQG